MRQSLTHRQCLVFRRMYSARDEGVGEEEEQLTPAGTASSRTEKRQNNIYKTSLKLNLKNVLLTLTNPLLFAMFRYSVLAEMQFEAS